MDGLHWLRQGMRSRRPRLALLAGHVGGQLVVIFWKLRLMRRAHVMDMPRCIGRLLAGTHPGHCGPSAARLRPEALILPWCARRSRSKQARPVPWPVRAACRSAHARAARCAAWRAGPVAIRPGAAGHRGSTAPFVGLLGTVWGIYHALTALTGAEQISNERLAGPVGEALIMTAAGLTVADPRRAGLQLVRPRQRPHRGRPGGLSRDLRELLVDTDPPTNGTPWHSAAWSAPRARGHERHQRDPLVDVMLVLVVIFILTAPLLPAASACNCRAPGRQGGTPEHAVSLAVDAAGQVYLDEAPVDAATLAQRLRQIANQRPDTEVQLRADRGVPYGRVVEVMDAAQAAGLTRMGFVAQPSSSK